MSLSKAAIFPKDNERYDVDTIYVGQMKDFCPKEFAANPGRKEFEACVSKLDINKMVEIKIPTFKETLDKSPKVSEYFKQGNYFVTGIKIPDKYFTLDEGYIKDGRTNYKTFNYNMLTFKGVGFGIACVNDSCKDLLNMLVDDVSQIPLIRTNGNKGNIVWIFGLDNTNSRGLWLEDGILISKASTFLPVRNFYDISAYGRPIFVSIAFVALFLVSLPFAVYLRKFYEYPAFSYFAGSTALWFALLNLTIFTSWLSGFTSRLFSIWVILNFLFSVLILNLAYARIRSMLTKRTFMISHLVILGLVFFAYIYFKNLGAIVGIWDKLEMAFAITAMLFALIPLGYSGYTLSIMLKGLKGQKTPVYFDHKRRINELIIYAIVWIIFCSSYIRFAYIRLGTGNVNSDLFFSTSIGAALLLLGIMLYYTQSKEVTHMADALSKQAQFMAHDIRRPFSQIKLVLSMFNSLSSDQKKLDSAKQDVENSIKRVESMLSDLIESGRIIPLNIRSLSVKDLIERALDQIDLNDHPIKINIVRVIDDALMVPGDEQKLIRCFVNILENAVEAVRTNHSASNNGTIEIFSKVVNVDGIDHAEIIVANNGPSIDEDDMSRLFESFFTKGKATGTGLGLAFTHRVISQHNGSVKAKNKSRNNGVEFIISLPAIKKTAPAKKLQLLLLDDEDLYRSLIKTLIAEDKTLTQVNVFEADSVKKAIAITDKEHITHTLVDIDLNDNEKGFAYLDYIHSKKLNITCAIHTNKYADPDMQAKINQYNVCYIPKPLDTKKLHSFIYQDKTSILRH